MAEFNAASATVVVPTHNRPEQVRACVASLRRQDYPAERYEIVVVDDGGDRELRLDCGLESGPKPRLIRQDNSGPAAARNLGAAHAEGAVLVFTDDDCRPRPDWLSTLVRAALDEPRAIIGGRTVNGLPGNLCAEASQTLVDYLYEAYRTPDGTVQFFTSNNIALLSESYRGLLGFSGDFPFAGGEDRDFCARWVECGGTMRYVPEAVVDHFHDLTLLRFWRQHFRYGRGAFYHHQRRVERTDRPRRTEALDFYWGMARFSFQRLGLARGTAVCSLIGLSQAANALGYFAERGRRAAPQDERPSFLSER